MKKVKPAFYKFLAIFYIASSLLFSLFFTDQALATSSSTELSKNPPLTLLSNQLFQNLEISASLNLPKGREGEFSENNIVFYNPNGKANNCNNTVSSYDGKVNMSGSNAYEKAWSAFRSIGYTKEQTAGIMGNLIHESSQLNPVTHEISQKNKWWNNPSTTQINGHFDLSKNESIAYGLGIIQFSFKWRNEMYNYVINKDPSLEKYFNEPNTYSPNYSYTGDSFIKDAGEDVFDKLFALQVEYLHDPNANSYYSRIKSIQNATTIEDMAGRWSAKVEICSQCAPGGSQYNQRIKSAQDIFQKYSHESFMSNGKSVTSNTNYTNNSTPTSGNHGSLLQKHSSVTFYGRSASENAGYTGKNASGKINGGNLADGQVAISTSDPDLKMGDIIYIETTSDPTKEASYAHGKYFIVADTGAGQRNGGYNIDVFHDVAKPSDNNPAPYGSTNNAKIYKVASNVSWEDYLSKYKNKSGGQSDGSDVTIIGDSITEMSKSALLKLLPKAKIIAQVSKHFAQNVTGNESGIEILKKESSSNNLRQVVVFALGTNDRSGVTLDQINEVIKLSTNRQLIFVTNYSKNLNENIEYQSKNNNLFKSAATNNKKITIADWNQAITAKPNLLSDNYHPTSAGAELFAKTIQEAINNVTTSGGSTLNVNCNDTTSANVVVVDGYTFPLQGATKANFLQPGNRNGAGESVLSPLPCKNYKNGACHHDYAALDMGLRKKMIDNHEFTSNDFPELRNKYKNPMMFYSTGVKVLAISDGTIISYKPYSRAVDGWQNRCASVQFKADDGTIFWIGHMSYDSTKKAGDKFKVGEVIGEIGPPPCAIGTQAHVHFQVGTLSAPGAPTTIYDIFNKLWESVPER